ncbi:hypothetical protein CUJ83_11715 [Methanocella sp. CWC-04]|uniref:Uncharacterized protein n=1 Tax=Methanooceanicella nereidis TaxID=2052831 RepID=A0AAP2W7W6_9EURY|nr:hypothetical protein [Methanocella sp. CWC-04]MCD1295664.1 hypothetical protein [Methanocella sp. CWC-04]
MEILSNISALFHIFLLVLVLLLSILVVLLTPKVREIENNMIKTISYIILGILSFSLVGVAFNLWQPSGSVDAVSLLQPYMQFYPIFILSIALSAVILVTYMEKERYGHIFAGAGFAVLLPDILTYIHYGRYDLVLLGFALWAIIPTLWVRMWKDNIYEPTTFKEKAIIALKAAILTYPVYITTGLVAIFGESQRSIDPAVMSSLTTNMQNIVWFVLITLWLYLLINTLIVSIMFVIHDLAIHTLNIRRVVTPKQDIQYIKEQQVIIKRQEKKERPDAYKGLIEEMSVFHKYLDQVDRLRAASTIARFKNEYQTIAARYNDGSKAEAERIIKSLDQEFKRRYA